MSSPLEHETRLARGLKIVEHLRRSALTIYDPIIMGDPSLWLPAPELEAVLRRVLPGLDLRGLALRTRSKVVKQVISEGLGYPIPPSFVRTQPRFVGQHFDVYIQKATNFQVWNEELDATRRYVLIHVNADDIVDAVKVVTGDRLAELDTTGTLTQKYQARFAQHTNPVGLLSTTDTPAVLAMIGGATLPGTRSVDYPSPGTVRPIAQLYASLSKLQGQTFSDLGSTQERNRGGELHKIV